MCERMRPESSSLPNTMADTATAMTDTAPGNKRAILHICTRETLRPLRDRVLTLSGFHVDSTLTHTEALSMFWARHYDLVLIDVEGETGIPQAEQLCSEIKTAQPGQLVAFVCNWRVAIMTDCPDEIVRTEFDPAAFAQGVRDIVPSNDLAEKLQ